MWAWDWRGFPDSGDDGLARGSAVGLVPQFQPNRRWILTAAAAVPTAALFGCAPKSAPSEPQPITTFFNDAERRFVDAATARLIPDGEDGLGARGAAVAFFIDRQMAGPFGQAATWYMQPPFAKGTDTQGYQLALTPAQLYRAAIPGVDAYCRGRFGGKAFAELAHDEQDRVLHALEGGEIELAAAPAKEFFKMLWQNTQEGFLADPMYGGNRNFVGWRLIGFPGPRYNYAVEISQFGKPYALPTVGLLGRDGSLIRAG